MASYNSLPLAALLLLSCATWVSATVYTVGGKPGWTIGTDYSAWARDKTFVVGDKLAFYFPTGAHTVTEVSSSDYASCSAANAISSISTGPALITLDTAGTHYYICGVPGHCAGGMRLAITVAATKTSSPSSPAPPSTPSTPSSTSPPLFTNNPSTPTTTAPPLFTNNPSTPSATSPPLFVNTPSIPFDLCPPSFTNNPTIGDTYISVGFSLVPTASAVIAVIGFGLVVGFF